MSEHDEVDPGRGQPPSGGADPVVPDAPELPDLDPNWQPTDIVKKLTQRYGGQLRERPRDRLWFPHLLIRGASGDTGQRPLWEPIPCWASPDIHLLPEGTDIDLTQTVQSPRVGERYTVGVHVWNLGRFPAHGVTVRAWWVEPGWFDGTPDPRYQPHYIGGTFTELGDRDSGDGHKIVPIPQPWLVEDQADGHECLFAVVDAFADPWSGALASNGDRHVAQRNLTLIRGQQDTASILDRLDSKVDVGEQLVLHLGAVTAASLRGAVERGMARFDDTSVGRGPVVLQALRRHSTLIRAENGWISDRLRPQSGPDSDDGNGPSVEPPTWPKLVRSGTDRLTQVVATLLGASGTSAQDLLASPHFGGARSAALHLTTDTTGYTVLLHD
jgi:hypothetical protein